MANIFKKQKTEEIDIKDNVKSMLLDENPEGIIAADENGNILYGNRLGNELMNMGLFGPIDIVSRNTKEFNYKDKTFTARYKRIPEESGIKGTIAYLTDKAEEEARNAKITELEGMLEHANGFKEAFLANMSHEIRTPIHAIIGFSEIMMKQNASEDLKEQINMIKNSSYSLLAIINDVLDLSKIESGKMELVNSNYYISYIIRDIEATFSLLAFRKGIKFEMHIADNIPCYIYGDKIRLRGTLFNILNNAIKFTKEGRVDFYIRVIDKKDGNATLEFEIKDTGVGIKIEDLDKIFESFSKFDINNNYAIEGRGLGLSIAQGYMDLMGGKIEVDSEYGVGSTFTVTVDQKIIDETPVDMNIVNARKQVADKFAISDYKALVVDDNSVNLTVAEGLMSTYKLKVDKASGGQLAIDKCKENKYDIIFMDQMMPEVDGIMAMKEIRKINDFYANECKIIVLTADAMAGVRDRLMAEGFDEYLCKPLEIHRLEALLKKFVPEENIFIPEKATDIKVVASGETANNGEEEIHALSEKLSIPFEALDRRVKDNGGTLAGYISICEPAVRSYEERIGKMRESQAVQDYNRYITTVHSLKSSVAALGAIRIADMAKAHEDAGKSGDFKYIDTHMEELIKEYEGFMQGLKVHVLGISDAESSLSNAVEGSEWTKEELSKVMRRISSLVEQYDFGAIYELLDDVSKMDMGADTRKLFNDLSTIMDDMDMDALKQLLGEYV